MSGRMGRAVNWLKSRFVNLSNVEQMAARKQKLRPGEPRRPDFDSCKTEQELKKKLDVYVKKSVAWQERERARLLAETSLNAAAQHRRRISQVFIGAAVSLIFLLLPFFSQDTLCFFDWWVQTWNTFIDRPIGVALVAAPVAYVIWLFRDTNARHQIENQRKDTNLKDFQQLCL